MKINIRVLPRSSRNEVVGKMADGTLKVKLTAAPVDGEANKKLLELLSKDFNVSKSNLTIVSGATSKNKVIEVSD
jgi:uncharacterized protein